MKTGVFAKFSGARELHEFGKSESLLDSVRIEFRLAVREFAGVSAHVVRANRHRVSSRLPSERSEEARKKISSRRIFANNSLSYQSVIAIGRLNDRTLVVAHLRAASRRFERRRSRGRVVRGAHSTGRPRKWSRRARRSCAIPSPRRAARLQRWADEG